MREIYDALAALRRKGVLPRATRSAKSKFVAVRVAPASTANAAARLPGASGVLCRIVQAGGSAIECLQWLEPSCVAAVSAVAASMDVAS